MSKNITQSQQEMTDLSKRLRAVAEQVPTGSCVADIGADHALLLIYLAQRKQLKRGIAGEVNLGPYENAQGRIQEAQLEQKIDVRRGDGLEVLYPKEVDTVVLSGMGGALMTSILDRGKSKLQGVNRLILQPNNGTYRLRAWLLEMGWRMEREELIRDGSILYELLVASPGMPDPSYEELPFDREIALRVGPLLWRHQHPLLKEKLTEELEGKEDILTSLQSGGSPRSYQRRLQIEREICEWRRMIQWLSKGTD
ncbi:SAM-dependent methyltransferase [Kroppenstedtia pulmonis]|uniref:SAM-dependent methyltransferase n=1 Tax=Kroppenstedtia pulmonis TaxID=1380685 RepID=A0A7D3XJ55_9BACL|nr:class I SAM-dependent methyltransferase [Kroppenstedtia pulmonis]QKG84924.1 SAM-dependent methyltransferase [Kroppenstedtia pulmonis]